MNFRITAVLFAVVIVLVAALLVSALFQDDPAKASGGLLDPLAAAGVKADDVDTVELARKSPTDDKLVFKRAGGRWELVGPAAARVDSFAVESVVRDLYAAKPVPYPGLSDSPAAHGLASPTFVVTLRKGDAAATVNLGTTLMGKDKAVTFVTTGDRPNTPVAVRTADLRSLFRDADWDRGGDPHILAKWLTEYRQKRLLSVDSANAGSDLEAVKITRGDRTLELARDGDDWRFAVPDSYGLADTAGDSLPTPNTFTGVRPLLNALVNLQAAGPEDFTEGVNPADLARYGLAAADPAVIRVELKPKGRPPEVLYIGKKAEKDGKPVVPTKVYVRLDGDSAVAAVTTDRLEAVVNTVADPRPLRNRDLIAEAKKDRIDAVDSTFGGGFKLRRVGGPAGPVWALYGTPGDPTDAQTFAVTNLINALARPRVATDVLPLDKPNDAAFADAQKKGELKVWFDGAEKAEVKDGKLPPEPKLTGEPVSFVFGQVEGNEVFVRRTAGGKAVDFRVPTDVFLAASKPRLPFVDPKLGSFAPAAAENVVLFRKGERLELKKEKEPDPAYRGGKWVYVAPDAKKGQPADGDKVLDLLSLLASGPVGTLHSEGATPDELKKLGLDPAGPVLSAKVTLPGEKEREREYHFGTDTADKKGVYFRLLGKPFVFVVDPGVFAQLETADLSDKVLFRVDPKKVRRLFLSGWKGVAKDGKAVSAELAVENGVWVSKDPAGVPVDAPRVDAILRLLEAPKATAFVTLDEDKPPPPEYGFGDSPVSVIAELEDKSSVQLRIGGPDKEKTGYYGQANRKTFVLAAAAVRAVLEKPPLSGR
jgi:hypothetical protein